MSVLFAQSTKVSDSVQRHPLGYVARVGQSAWRYVLLDAGAASVDASEVLSWLDSDGYEATGDVSAGQGMFAGALAVGGSFTDGEYAFIQFEGPAVVKTSGGSLADGDYCILGADGVVAESSADPAAVADIKAGVGRAMATEASSLVEVMLGGK